MDDLHITTSRDTWLYHKLVALQQANDDWGFSDDDVSARQSYEDELFAKQVADTQEAVDEEFGR